MREFSQKNSIVVVVVAIIAVVIAGWVFKVNFLGGRQTADPNADAQVPLSRGSSAMGPDASGRPRTMPPAGKF